MASINEISKAVQKTLKLFSMLQASIKAIGLGVDENAIKDKTDKTLVELVGQLSHARKLLEGDTAFATASGQSRQYLTYSGVSWHEVALGAVSDFLRDIYIASVYDAPIDNDAKADLLLDLPAVLPVCSWSTEAIQKCGVLDADIEKLLADVRSELMLAQKLPKTEPVNVRMAAALADDPNRETWTTKQFAKHLDCSKTAVQNTQVWKGIMKLREQAKQSRRSG